MNKILRIVGYAVLVIALALSSVLIVKVCNKHNETAAMQEKVDEAEELYNSNQEDIDKNMDKAHQKMEEYKYYVRSSVLPLYSDSQPISPAGVLNAGDELYADGISQNGMIHVFAQVDGKEGEYYTFPGLVAKEMTEQPVRVSVVSLDSESDIAEAAGVAKAFYDLMASTDSCALVCANEETAAFDWNTIAKDCGADAHIVLSAIVKGEDDNRICSVTADDVIQSKALAQELNRILGDNKLAEPKITEETAEDDGREGEEAASEESAGEETESEPAEDTTETESLEETVPEAAETPEETSDSDVIASCSIIMRTVKAQIADDPESVGTEETSEDSSEESSEETDDTDYTAQIINCIKAGLENYLSKL